MTAHGPAEQLAAFLAEARRDPVLALIGGSVVGIGWATVELERGAAELGTALGLEAAALAGAPASATLGARTLVCPDGLGPGVALILLEPTTEGRLAATLARRGEGPAAAWLEVGDLPAALDAARRVGTITSSERPGPLGPERLVLDRAAHGPHHLLVGRPGTIAS